MTAETVTILWTISIVILLIVTAVVGFLLSLILRSARNIESVVGNIWTTGKMVANNTIHIPLLRETNRLAGAILQTAGQVVAGSAALEQHVEGCPGCPYCVLEQ